MGSPEFSWKLADHPRLPKGKTVVVVVLDGLGDANPDQYNCIHVADTLAMDSLKKVGRTTAGVLTLPVSGRPYDRWGVDLTCVSFPRRVGHVGGLVVRGREDVVARSTFAISFFPSSGRPSRGAR
ncbi:hypothetical protein B296_00036490 [Ensete ventricosum]|uniref:Metalloenzyme domain-containing protein n=1 Tax=Ensete ventricosum TaxID=4639 RepID=A0A426XNR2_ENSVE|nr:hypothetical protein B296_00036490 [Ensete ventricosum]